VVEIVVLPNLGDRVRGPIGSGVGTPRMRSNIRDFGSTKAPPNSVRRPRSIIPPMLDALCEHLLEKPELCQEEMVLFLLDEFKVHVTTSSVARALKSIGWTKKIIRHVAKGRNADLRDLYLYNTSDFRSYHYVFVDESGCDKRIGFRWTGWSPLGVTPIEGARFQREKRYQILPAYTQDGVILVRVFQGSTDATVFEELIEQLIPLCGKWPEPKSVLVMDSASFHHIARIEQKCYSNLRKRLLPKHSLIKSQPHFLANPCKQLYRLSKAQYKGNVPMYLSYVIVGSYGTRRM
jgi:DDE superfamily endonuclease